MSTIEETTLVGALNAIIAHSRSLNKSKNELILSDQFVNVIVALSKKPENRVTPFRIPLENAIFSTGACLITHDKSFLVWKNHLEAGSLTGITRVLSVSNLKKDFHQFSDRRELCNSHDLFLADKKIIKLLAPLMGKTFFSKKKQPVPVKLAQGKFDDIEEALSSTFMYLHSDCINVKVGKVSDPISKLLNNLQTALPHIVGNIPRKWNNIVSIHVKTAESIALPVFSSQLSKPLEKNQTSLPNRA